MKASAILNANDIDDLKLLGSYRELKKSIETELDTKLGVNGWRALFEKILVLKKVAPQLKEKPSIYEKKSFVEAKIYLSDLLGIKIKARGWEALKLKISNLVELFTEPSFDPYSYYEKTKLKKFRDSSKLEGIDVDYPNKKTSLESILAKYKR